jgi:hypothetical protein
LRVLPDSPQIVTRRFRTISLPAEWPTGAQFSVTLAGRGGPAKPGQSSARTSNPKGPMKRPWAEDIDEDISPEGMPADKSVTMYNAKSRNRTPRL